MLIVQGAVSSADSFYSHNTEYIQTFLLSVYIVITGLAMYSIPAKIYNYRARFYGGSEFSILNIIISFKAFLSLFILKERVFT